MRDLSNLQEEVCMATCVMFSIIEKMGSINKLCLCKICSKIKAKRQCFFSEHINLKAVFQLQAERAIEHALSILIRVSSILLTRGSRTLIQEHPAHAHAVLK